MERSFYPENGYTSSDPRPKTSFDPIRVMAYEAIRNHKSSVAVSPTIETHIASDFPKDELSYLTTQLQEMVNYWSDRFVPNTSVIATFGTENSNTLNWENYMSNKEDADWIISTYKDPAKAPYLNCGWKNGIAGSHILWSGANRGKIGYWIIFPSQHDGKYWLPKNLPHEFTHGIQDLIWQLGGYPDQSKNIYNVIEGGAELFGTALGYPNLGWYSDEVNRFVVEGYLGNPANRSIPQNTNDVLQMLDASEHNDNGPGTVWAYTVGLHLWEYVLATYGFDSYWDIVKNVQNMPTYDDAIRKSIGISKAELYSKAAPYILRSFKQALATYEK